MLQATLPTWLVFVVVGRPGPGSGPRPRSSACRRGRRRLGRDAARLEQVGLEVLDGGEGVSVGEAVAVGDEGAGAVGGGGRARGLAAGHDGRREHPVGDDADVVRAEDLRRRHVDGDGPGREGEVVQAVFV